MSRNTIIVRGIRLHEEGIRRKGSTSFTIMKVKVLNLVKKYSLMGTKIRIVKKKS
jgi:hypothetical protein